MAKTWKIMVGISFRNFGNKSNENSDNKLQKW